MSANGPRVQNHTNLQNPFSKPPKKDSGLLTWSNNHHQMAQIPFFLPPEKGSGAKRVQQDHTHIPFLGLSKKDPGFREGARSSSARQDIQSQVEKKTRQSVCEGGANGGKSQRLATESPQAQDSSQNKVQFEGSRAGCVPVQCDSDAKGA